MTTSLTRREVEGRIVAPGPIALTPPLCLAGTRYEQRLERLMEHPQLTELMTIYAEKYGAGLVSAGPGQLQAALTNGDFWLFEVVDR